MNSKRTGIALVIPETIVGRHARKPKTCSYRDTGTHIKEDPELSHSPRSEVPHHMHAEGELNLISSKAGFQGKWSDEEHRRLLEALGKFGNNWLKVSDYVGTRTRAQARSHTQKYFEKVRQEQLSKLKSDPRQRCKLFLVTRQYLNRSFLHAKEINEFEVLPVQRKRKKVSAESLPAEQEKNGNPFTTTIHSQPHAEVAFPGVYKSTYQATTGYQPLVEFPYILPLPSTVPGFYPFNPNFFYIPYK